MKSTTALVLLAGGLTAINAQATDQALIDTLVSKGYLTQQEAVELSSEAPIPVKPKGKAVEKLTISGRLHYQYDYFDAERGSEGIANANHFYFRRLYWGAKVDLGNNWKGELNFDFAGDEIEIDKAYVGYDHSDWAQFKFGYFKAPFGVEETTSSSKIKAVERSVVNRFFADDLDFSARHAGISVEGQFEGGLFYAFMLGNAAQGEGSRLGGATNSNNQLATFGRIQYKTKIDSTKILVGVDGGYQSDNHNNSIGAAASSRGAMTAGTAYAQVTAGGLFIQPEVFMGTLDRVDANTSDEDTYGYSILAAYKLGDFEPVARYSYLDSESVIDTDELIRRAPAGVDSSSDFDDIHSVFVGFNYYLQGNDLKLSAGYEWAEAEGDKAGTGAVKSEIQGFRTRLQLLF